MHLKSNSVANYHTGLICYLKAINYLPPKYKRLERESE